VSRFRPLVLCFHAVSDEWDHQLAVRPELFETVVGGLLRRGFRPVAADGLAGGGRRALHVTFDDAYRSVWEAVPALERLGARATVFAATAFADEGRPLDVPELADAAAAHPEHLATMDWASLRELAERGLEIGSHTVGHPHLPTLSDEELDRELRDSRARCEDELGRPCRFLAYPYGEADPRVQAAAERAGYAGAFLLHGPSRPYRPFALPRVDIYRSDSPARARLKTSGLRELAWAVLDRADRSRSQAARQSV
jgi:peptidoglycan/xylan/chitin deacetylase (PgdA/CDA1 family)